MCPRGTCCDWRPRVKIRIRTLHFSLLRGHLASAPVQWHAARMEKQFVQLIVGFVVLTALFWVIEYAWPGVRWQKRFRCGFATDIGYWVHRAFHSRWLWKIQTVHHGARELNWLSALRLYPVNDIVTRICQAVPFGAGEGAMPDSFWGQLIYPFRRAGVRCE